MPSITLDTPQSLEDLSQAEHLLVWGLRTMAVGHGDCPLLDQTFGRMCGPLGPAALQAWFIFVKLAGMTSRRPLQVHAPGCPCIGTDETAVVGVIAAAQQALEGDDRLLRMRLNFLSKASSAETLVSAALSLARVLADGGQRLPLRLEDAFATDAEPGRLRAVH